MTLSHEYLHSDGKANTYTFRRFRKRTPILHSLYVNGEAIKDHDVITNLFDKHMQGVAGPVTPSDLEMSEYIKEFEPFFGQKLEKFCKAGKPPESKITLKEIEIALKSMSANSARRSADRGKP